MTLKAVALKIACIHPNDRKWILNQLSETEQEQLRPLLEEIEQLGLNRDPSTIMKALQVNGTQPTSQQQEDLQKYEEFDMFWQRILLSPTNGNSFEKLIKLKTKWPDDIKPFSQVPTKLFSVVNESIKGKMQ